MKIFNIGAESKIIEIIENKKIFLKKIRIEKKYRIKQIDEKIRKFRNSKEFKILKKLNENKINTPKVFDLNEKEYSFKMEKIEGETLNKKLNKENLKKAFEKIIEIHNLDVIHNDLTLLNFLIESKTKKVFLIDFGLSFISKKIEDKAVDLNLFFENLKNENLEIYKKYKKKLIDLYKKQTEDGLLIIQRLEKVEIRGRNKN